MLPSPNDRIVLLADATGAIARDLCTPLTQTGYRFVHAKSGPEAFRILQTMRVDVVATAVDLPGLGGLELLEIIQRAGLATPVIVVTAAGDRQRAHAALRLGCYDVIEHDFDPTALLRALASAMNLSVMQHILRSRISPAGAPPAREHRKARA